MKDLLKQRTTRSRAAALIRTLSAFIVIGTALGVSSAWAQSRVIRDIAYAEPGHAIQKLDLILPVNATSEPMPVLLFVHGGAWKHGDKQFSTKMLREYVDSKGIAAVSINYRLSGDAKWPAQLHDCKATVRWIRANADRYGFDSDRIVAWGTSAGAHLVSMLAVTPNDSKIDGNVGPNDSQSTHILAAIDFFGPVNLATMKEPKTPPGKQSPIDQLLGGDRVQLATLAKSASPIHHVSRGDSAFLIMHGTADPLVPQSESESLHQALKKAGVDSTLMIVPDAKHGFTDRVSRPIVEEFLDRMFHRRSLQEGQKPSTAKASPAAASKTKPYGNCLSELSP